MAGNGLLNQKVAIITGASSGIGKATALRFAREGAALVLADRNEDALAEVTRLASAEEVKAVMKKTDVSNEAEVKELIEMALAAFPDVHILCNNAGITGNSMNLCCYTFL
jgi:NAD(P)-dependent dehydrogenase (short-subunit alcohol dehydrogenase family)